MRCLYLHCSSALLRGLLPWPPRGCLKEVKQLLHSFLTRKEMKENLQCNRSPFQEGRGELFPWPPSQRGHRNHQEPPAFPCHSSPEPWEKCTLGWLGDVDQCWHIHSPPVQTLSISTAIFCSCSDSHQTLMSWLLKIALHFWTKCMEQLTVNAVAFAWRSEGTRNFILI